MKIKFNRQALQEALALAAAIVPSRTTKPILQCLKIEAQDDTVNISATDFEIGITCCVPQAQIEAGGAAVLSADKLSAIVRESIDEVIQFEQSDSTCLITGADSHYTVFGHPPEQFPSVPGPDGEADIEAELARLQEAIDHCLFAAAKESTRYALNGILWELKGKKLVLVGTDGRRLAKYQLTLAKAADKKIDGSRLIVPAKAMAMLDRIGAAKETVSVKVIDSKIIFSCKSAVISSNLVEGNFPKYEDIIPADYDKKLTLGTAAMLSAVKRTALLTNEDSKGIKLSISAGKLILSGRAPEMGDAQIDMAVEYDSEPVDIGFNPQFLVDVLRVIKAEQFELHLGQSDRPGMIKSGPNYLYIVMPVNLG